MLCPGIEFCHDVTYYTTSPLTERVAGPCSHCGDEPLRCNGCATCQVVEVALVLGSAAAGMPFLLATAWWRPAAAGVAVRCCSEPLQ